MTYLLIIILIGVAIYYSLKWNGSSKRTNNNNGDNTFQSTSNTSNTNRQNPSSGTNYAKWIGGGLGWAFGGPIGGILGFMAGSMVGGSANSVGAGSSSYGQTRSGDFNISLLILAAAVMKADGKVTKSELDYVKQFLTKNFGREQASQLVKMLGNLLKQNYNLQDVSYQIKQYMDYSSRLMLLQFMYGISLSDGKSHANEINVIETIARYLGISDNDIRSIKAMFIKDTNSAYQILEISPDVTNDEVKKAYREMAKKYHPDKVSHLGEEVKKAAEEKITMLNAAYEAVKDERGMN
mgnify:FL=1